ncbi:MAG: hypothetical protein ACTSVV_05665 [Promethearchaeota archaeon]
MEWNIGTKAKQLDQKSISERLRIEKRSIRKMFVALGIYFIFIGIFTIFL